MLDPRNTLTSLGKRYSMRRETLARHRKRCLSDNVSKALEIHAKVSRAIELGDTAGEIARLRDRADRLGAVAEATGKLSTALQAVSELRALIELQARLILEAQAGRGSDLLNHPSWHEIIGDLMHILREHPAAALAFADAVRRRTGQAPALVSSDTGDSVG